MTPPSDDRKHADDQAVIVVRGLSCRGCAWRLHRALARAPGVHEASVNPFAETVSIKFDKAALDTDDLLQLIREAGLEPRTLRAIIPIPELVHAPSAARSAVAAVRKVAGIESVAASPTVPGLLVAYDPQRIDASTLARAVKGAGFPAGAVRAEEESVEREHGGVAAFAALVAALGAGVVVAARMLEVPHPLSGWLAPIAAWSTTLATIVVALFAVSGLVALAPLFVTSALRIARGGIDESVLSSLGILTGFGAALASAIIQHDLTPLLAVTCAAAAVATIRWMLSRHSAATHAAEERGDVFSFRLDPSQRGPQAHASWRIASRAMPSIALVAILAGVGTFFARQSVLDALLALSAVLIAGFGGALVAACERVIAFALRRLHIGSVHVRDAEALERASSLRTIIADDSTFYRPVPEVSDYVLLRGETQAGLLRRAAVAFTDSDNPIAKAIRARAGSTEGETPFVQASADPGRGVAGKVGRRECEVGIPEYLAIERVRLDDAADEIARFYAEGKRVIGVALDKSLVGLIALREPMREGARTAVESLRAHGVEVVCATTDSEALANARTAPLAVSGTTLVRDRAQRDDLVRLRMRDGLTGVVVARSLDASQLRLGDLGVALGDAPPLLAAADIVVPAASPVALAQCVTQAKSAMIRVAKNRQVWVAFQIVAVLLPVAVSIAGFAAAAPFAAAATAFIGTAVTLRMSGRNVS
ncbi:MAG: heavy metal translocating P-type ATPase [Thermoanaerobaculia bacterium]